MPLSSESTPIFGSRLAAGTIPAERQPDGTIVVQNVPIFSEIRPTDPGAESGDREPRDLSWLERALEKHKARRVLGQKPAMTLRHIFDGPQRVGDYELTHVAQAEVNPGEPPRWTLFGKKIYASEADFKTAQSYDFRSAEISPDAPDEIAALALLRDKMPFHRYPNTKEELEPELVQAFESWGGRAPQIWKGRIETFSSAVDLKKPKEGVMPADVKDAKTPSLEERMEACMAKGFEAMMAKFEGMLSKAAEGKTGDLGDKKDGAGKNATAKADDDTAPASVEKAEAKPDADEKPAKKLEAAQTRGGPNDMLPPAVSELRIGEIFSANGAHGSVPEQFAAKMATQETAILGLRSQLDKMQREKDAIGLVAEGRKALNDMGVGSVPEAFEQRLYSAAVKGGKQGVNDLLADVKLTMGLQSRAPEIYGASASISNMSHPSAGDADLKKTVEVFGARPEVKGRIHELYAGYREMPEHFRRSASFFDVCSGHPEINPACMDARGGLGRKA